MRDGVEVYRGTDANELEAVLRPGDNLLRDGQSITFMGPADVPAPQDSSSLIASVCLVNATNEKRNETQRKLTKTKTKTKLK